MRATADNPRNFPRWRKSPRPVCPVHGRTMHLVPLAVPRFCATGATHKRGEERAEQWRKSRKIYRCPVPGCPRVHAGNMGAPALGHPNAREAYLDGVMRWL